MARQIFRQAALNRLSTPEQLDQLIEIAPVRDRLALAALASLLLAALAWGLLGTLIASVGGAGTIVPDPAGQGDAPLAANIALPASTAARVRPGQAVRVYPAGGERAASGALRGTVRAVAASGEASPSGPVVRVEVALEPAPAGTGPSPALAPGSPCRAEIVVDRRRPLARLLSGSP